MKLYHGSSSRFLVDILQNGIRPRGEQPSQWEKYPSHSEMVYLTTAYPFFFASQALSEDAGDEERLLVCELESDLLNENCFFPDEDFISQIVAQVEKRRLDSSHEEARKNIKLYQHFWKVSVSKMGNLAYKGVIPPTAITRYCLMTIERAGSMSDYVLDPSISIQNFSTCGEKYTGFVAWCFGDQEMLPTDAFIEFGDQGPDAWKEMVQKRKDYWKSNSKNRTGIEVINVKR